MTEHENIISALNNKVEKMFSVVEKYKTENEHLKDELEQLKLAVKTKDLECLDYQTKLDNLKLAKVIQLSGNDFHEAKIKVNRIVREIDRCIALLNR